MYIKSLSGKTTVPLVVVQGPGPDTEPFPGAVDFWGWSAKFYPNILLLGGSFQVAMFLKSRREYHYVILCVVKRLVSSCVVFGARPPTNFAG